MKRNSMIVFIMIFIVFFAVYYLVKINDSRIIDLHLVHEGGGYSPEVYFTLDKSGKLELYLAQPGVPLHVRNRDDQLGVVHKTVTLNADETREIQTLARQIFWKVWFTYEGKHIPGDHEGFWRRKVGIDGKNYAWYNYPYSENRLNVLVNKLIQNAPHEIRIDKDGAVIVNEIEELYE